MLSELCDISFALVTRLQTGQSGVWIMAGVREVSLSQKCNPGLLARDCCNVASIQDEHGYKFDKGGQIVCASTYFYLMF